MLATQSCQSFANDAYTSQTNRKHTKTKYKKVVWPLLHVKYKDDTRAELGRAEPSVPGRAGPSQAGPSQAGPSQAGPSQAGPSQAGPGRAGPGDLPMPPPDKVGINAESKVIRYHCRVVGAHAVISGER